MGTNPKAVPFPTLTIRFPNAHREAHYDGKKRLTEMSIRITIMH